MFAVEAVLRHYARQRGADEDLWGLAGLLHDLDWEKHVRIDERYFRPTEVDVLCGDPSKAERVLGWRPQVRFAELVRIMLEADLREAGLDPARWMPVAETAG
jgi:GDP-D-mannose dehydratase